MTEDELFRLWDEFEYGVTQVEIIVGGHDVTEFVRSLVLQHDEGAQLTIHSPGVLA